jgi:hypothetical protein
MAMHLLQQAQGAQRPTSNCRKQAARLNAAWWAEHHATMEELGRTKARAPDIASIPEAQADLEPAGPVVQGGYMEASLDRRITYPIYWPAQPRALLRGTWFVESARGKGWLPLPHPVAATLEARWQQRCARAPRRRQALPCHA